MEKIIYQSKYLCHGPFSEFEFVTKIPILQTYLVLRQHFINSDKIGCNGISLNSSLTVWVDTSYRPLHSVWLQILPSVKYFPLIFHDFFHFLLSSIFLPYLITFWSSALLHFKKKSLNRAKMLRITNEILLSRSISYIP